MGVERFVSGAAICSVLLGTTRLFRSRIETRLCVLAAAVVGLTAVLPARAQGPFAPPPPPGQASNVRGVASPSTFSEGPIAPQVPRSEPITPTPADATRSGPATISPGAQPLEGGKIVARVDGQVILASDVLWQVNQMIDMNRDQIPPSEVATVRDSLLERQVLSLVDTKLLFADFRRNVPAENLPKISESLAEPFGEHEIPRLLKVLQLESKADLEQRLVSYGTTLDEVQRQFTERTIAGEWLRQRVPKPKEATHEQMLAYYQEHRAEYEHPAKARWEELMIRIDRHNGDAAAAWKELAELGNQIWAKASANQNHRGPVFGELAREHSHGFTASEGGLHDWTTIGALRCEAINDALRDLKIGQLSDGIVSEDGYHIIRVLERKPAGRTPFTEVQTEIRKALEAEQRQELVGKEIKKLRREASVWTVFHGDLSAERIAELLEPGQQRK